MVAEGSDGESMGQQNIRSVDESLGHWEESGGRWMSGGQHI